MAEAFPASVREVFGVVVFSAVALGLVASAIVERSRLRAKEHPMKALYAQRLRPLPALSWYEGAEHYRDTSG